MTIEIVLNAEDYLTYHLYISSKSKLINAHKRILWQLWALCFFLLGCSFLESREGFVPSIIFFCMAVLWYIFYPMYFNRDFKTNQRNYVLQQHKDCFGVVTMVTFEDGDIYMKDEDSEARFKETKIVEITEIASYLFIKLSAGSALIIPKTIKDYDEFYEGIVALAHRLNLTINKELDWKW